MPEYIASGPLSAPVLGQEIIDLTLELTLDTWRVKAQSLGQEGAYRLEALNNSMGLDLDSVIFEFRMVGDPNGILNRDRKWRSKISPTKKYDQIRILIAGSDSREACIRLGALINDIAVLADKEKVLA